MYTSKKENHKKLKKIIQNIITNIQIKKFGMKTLEQTL